MKLFRKGIGVFISILLVYAILFYIPLPYYITQPGSAEELDQYVTVQNGYKDKGDFMFTTVGIARATPFWLLAGAVLPFHEIDKKDDIMLQGESEKDYDMRQNHYMKTAQEKAVYNAYKYAGKDVKKIFEGIFIMYVYEGMPADGVLHVGDLLKEVDGEKITSTEQLNKIISSKKIGEKVNFIIKRDKKELDVSIPIKQFTGATDKKGIGISYEEEISVMEQPQTVFHLKDVGGPSAGLMFTLEIYNQLTEVDYTKGHKIAGTGTIDYDGIVGPIGGISQKIVAADKEGAEIFFAPNEEGKKGSNYREAVKTAKKIKTKMKIIPVDNVNDAIDYLKSLT